MIKKCKILFCALLCTILVACDSSATNDESNNKIVFEKKYNLLDEKVKGQNSEWPVLAITEPKTINAKEIAENEIDYAIIYIYEQNQEVTNTVEMYKGSKYTLDIFNESGSYTYELSNTDTYKSIEKGTLDI